MPIDQELAEQIREHFVSTINHELRTPIHALMSLSHILLDTQLSAEQRELVQMIYTNAQELTEVLSTIMSYAELVSGHLTFKSAPVDLSRLAMSIGDKIVARVQNRGINFQCLIDKQIPTILMGDENRLERILIQLLDTSIRFPDHGSMYLRVRLEEDYTTQVTISFSIIDAGTDPDLEETERLSRSFSQAYSTLIERYSGFGLGLITAKKLIEWMGGQLTVEEECRCSVVRVSLPFNKSHENISNASGASNSSALAIDQHPPPYSDSVSPTVPESPRFVTDQYFVYSPLSKAVESAEHGHLKPLYPLTEETRSLPTPPLTIPFPMKILVAEDNKTNQLIAKNLLNLPNCSVDIVSNGQEAFEMLKNNTYHLVLMDVQMPIMNGMVATRLIRSPDSEVVDPNIPIVAMTACVTTTHRDKCLSAGMNDFLSKPINSDELMAVIHRYCPKKPPLPISSFNDSPEPETDCFIFDPQGLSLRLRNDKDLCRELIEVFLTDVPQLITQLKIALADGQLPQAQHIAHTIKGAAKNVNAEALAQHSQAIETLTKEQNLDGAQAKLVFLEAAFDRLKLELDKFVIAVAT